MDRDTWLKHYKATPEAIQYYFLDTLSSQNEAKVQQQLAYDNDAWERVMDIVWDVVFTQLSRQKFMERAKAIAGDRKPEDVERSLLLHVILPLADIVAWDVEGRLQELGIPLSEIQSVQRISLRPVSYGAAVRRIAAQAKISILSEELFRRTRDLLVSFLKGVRTKEQILEQLQRQQGEGGIGLSKEQSERFCETMENFIASVQILSEQDFADWFTAAQRQQSTINKQPSTLNDRTSRQDEAELVQRPAPQSTNAVLEKAIDTCLTKLALTNLDDYLTKRLRNIVSIRLREVRSVFQTKAILERETKIGGMGFLAADAERIAGVIEAVFQEQRSQIALEEKQKITEIAELQKQKIEERRKRESEEHTKWYEERIQGGKTQTQAQNEMREAFQKMQRGETPKTQIADVESGMPKVDSRLQEKTVDSVIPPVRLYGLTEELGNLTWQAFRRMSRSPDQAAEKIWQKFETLKQESFERWTEGLSAWRQSPLQKIYLTLISESFSTGKPVSELVEEKRPSQQELPTNEELGAIIQLNQRLQI